MESQSTNPEPPPSGDDESRMRRNLGLMGAPEPATAASGMAAPASNDPMRMARQALRAQTAAREYAERQLAQAQAAIQDLRNRMRHVHQERDGATNAAHAAMAAKANAERALAALESNLAAERSNRERTERMLRESEIAIRDLREKLAAATQTAATLREEIENLNRKRKERPLERAPVEPPEDAPVRRPVGRPRKYPLAVADPAPERRPVGRPRKHPEPQPAVAASVRRRTPAAELGDAEPVQWWVEGWKKK